MTQIGSKNSNFINQNIMLIEELKNIKSSRKDLRNFGLVIGIALIILSAFLAYYEKEIYFYFALLGGLFIVTAYIYPKILFPLQKIWMAVAVTMGFFITRILLIIIFYLILTPISLILRLFGKKFLDLKIDKNAKTYWNKRETQEFSKDNLHQQF